MVPIIKIDLPHAGAKEKKEVQQGRTFGYKNNFVGKRIQYCGWVISICYKIIKVR